jgi:hypothetical protein
MVYLLLLLTLWPLSGDYWFFLPLLVFPLACVLECYLRSHMGRRLCGTLITNAQVERVGIMARVIASLVFAGLLLWKVLEARQSHPSFSGGWFAAALVLTGLVAVLLVTEFLIFVDRPAAVREAALRKLCLGRGSLAALALICLAAVLGICQGEVGGILNYGLFLVVACASGFAGLFFVLPFILGIIFFVHEQGYLRRRRLEEASQGDDSVALLEFGDQVGR